VTLKCIIYSIFILSLRAGAARIPVIACSPLDSGHANVTLDTDRPDTPKADFRDTRRPSLTNFYEDS